MTDSYDGVGDVVVEDARRVEIAEAEDVFVAADAAAGPVEIADAEDVYVRPDAGASVVRDVVLDGSRQVDVDGAEDVHVAAGAVAEALVVEGAGDVYVGETDDLTVRGVQDVYVEGGAVADDSAAVVDAQDVHVETDAVAGELAVENPEDVLHGGDLDVEREQFNTSYRDAPGRLRLADVEDVHLDRGAVDEQVWVTDAEWVGEE